MQLYSYLIIGNGVFGASTALSLIQRFPKARVTLVDRNPIDCPLGASSDLNKIMRIEYDDADYVHLALKAQRAWRECQFYSRFYQPAVQVSVDDSGMSQKVLDTLYELSLPAPGQLLNVKSLKSRYGGLFDATDFAGESDVYVNENSGYLNAGPALLAVLQECLRLGVCFRQATVTELVFDSDMRCTGARLSSGEALEASHTILAAGAGSVRILADSHTTDHPFPIENRLLAAAVVAGTFTASSSEQERLKDSPIFIRDLSPFYGESLPLVGSKVKIASETSFKNTTHHVQSGQTISLPAPGAFSKHQFIPRKLHDECRDICSRIFGYEKDAINFESMWICWDAFAADGDFFISEWQSGRGLFFATGGSFHSWKFLPILGDLIVDTIEGNLDEHLRQKWLWDRPMPTDGGDVELLPEREWKDLID